jgi:hypothetical protein
MSNGLIHFHARGWQLRMLKPHKTEQTIVNYWFHSFYNIYNLFNKNVFARDLNTYTSVPESTKIVPVQPIYMPNTRCARGHVATSSGDSRCSSEKISQKKKHCSRRVDDQRRMCLGRLCTYFLYWRCKSGKV